jgi:sarcosine oxidase
LKNKNLPLKRTKVTKEGCAEDPKRPRNGDKTYDVIIVGLGAMGSAAAYHLAASGTGVLGLDRLRPPHSFGSSHGRTRIIREAYFEHPSYVPLVQRAYELWAGLEKRSGRKLLLQTGGLMVGPANGALVSGALRSAEEHTLAHKLFSAAELRQRFPVFNADGNTIAVWEPRAGILFPELIIQTHLELAVEQGACLRFDEPVLGWQAGENAVSVTTTANSYRANRLLIAAGAWLSSLLNPTSDARSGKRNTQAPRKVVLPLSVERQVLFWFEPVSHAGQFRPENCPIYIWEYEPGRFFYGFPDLGDGVKVAFHHQGDKTEPDQVHREVGADEIEKMRSLLSTCIPWAAGRLKSQAVCIYTNTPDEHFIFDWHPEHPSVLVASPCSGHGFKFSSAIGELSANLLIGKNTTFDLSRFTISRFQE